MSYEYKLVADFNTVILGIEDRVLGLQIQDEYLLSHKQLVEEADEFLEASRKGDLVEAIDACIDSIVFSMGILYKLGITNEQFEDIFEVVMSANMTKKIGVKVGREGFDSEDAVKPDNWEGPESTIRRILYDT